MSSVVNSIPAFIPFINAGRMRCDWQLLRFQLLSQWKKISDLELDSVGPNRKRLARLIERKYGIAARLAEHYLWHFERTLPQAE